MTPQLNAVLESIQADLQSDLERLGVGEIAQPSTDASLEEANAALDRFIASVAEQVMTVTDLDEDAALDFVLDSVEQVHPQGFPPAEDDDPESMLGWLEAANASGVASQVVQAAQQ
jgi:hypothetical protein